MSGKILARDIMILRRFVAENEEYQIYLTIPREEPIVQSVKTGRYFHLSWSDIISQAQAAGIDEEEVMTAD